MQNIFSMKFLIIIFVVVVIYNLIKYAARRVMEQYTQGGNINKNQYQQKKEGEVTIKSDKEDQKKVFDKNDGDYVDFEEVK